MSQPDRTGTTTCREQVYLLQRDAGLLCRILGPYAARAIDVAHVDYPCAARDLMRLRIGVAHATADADHAADAVRVLVAGVSTLVGVSSAVEQLELAVHSDEEVSA